MYKCLKCGNDKKFIEVVVSQRIVSQDGGNVLYGEYEVIEHDDIACNVCKASMSDCHVAKA